MNPTEVSDLWVSILFPYVSARTVDMISEIYQSWLILFIHNPNQYFCLNFVIIDWCNKQKICHQFPTYSSRIQLISFPDLFLSGARKIEIWERDYGSAAAFYFRSRVDIAVFTNER